MSKSIPCICVDAKNKPKEIPQDKWPSEGSEYHVNHIFVMRNQNNIQGCELSEFDISMYAPYNCYRLSRFGFTAIEAKVKLEAIKFLDFAGFTSVMYEYFGKTPSEYLNQAI